MVTIDESHSLVPIQHYQKGVGMKLIELILYCLATLSLLVIYAYCDYSYTMIVAREAIQQEAQAHGAK